VPKYLVNRRGVAKARQLIDAHHYRMRSQWADVQPRAAEQNAFLPPTSCSCISTSRRLADEFSGQAQS